MATCKDCIYYEFCEYVPINDIGIENKCKWFKNKANMVEVVRCKECKHWGGVTFGYICRRFSGTYIRNETRETDFCSYGERRGKE